MEKKVDLTVKRVPKKWTLSTFFSDFFQNYQSLYCVFGFMWSTESNAKEAGLVWWSTFKKIWWKRLFFFTTSTVKSHSFQSSPSKKVSFLHCHQCIKPVLLSYQNQLLDKFTDFHHTVGDPHDLGWLKVYVYN